MLRDSRQSGCVGCGALELRRGDQVPRDQLLHEYYKVEHRQNIYEIEAENTIYRVELTRRGRRRRRRLSIARKPGFCPSLHYVHFRALHSFETLFLGPRQVI